MNRYLSLITLMALIACSSPKQSDMQDQSVVPFGPTKQTLSAIKKSDLKRNLTFLASDELKGRNTASPELKIAAKFISSELEAYGFKGIGPNGSFLQRVPLFQPSFDNNSIKVSYAGNNLKTEYGKDIAIFAWGNADLDFTLPLSFIREGIPSQYNASDIKGKAVVRLQQSDEQKAQTKSTHQQVRDKLFAQGAKVVILLVRDNDDAQTMIDRYDRLGSRAAMTNRAEENPRAYVIMKESVFNQIVKADKIKSFNYKKNASFKKDFSLNLKSDSEDIYSNNVVAVLEGTDPVLKNEYVGFGAHYDHDGVKNGQIYNGANDDGSGTSGLISVAKAMGKNPPKRSILVVFHTAEEKGLLGSEYFTDHPLIDLKQLVSMTNMDMIGSNFQPERVYVVGSDRISQELHDINEMVNSALDSMVLDYEWNAPLHPERIYYRSDHYNYGKNGVPIIFYSDKDPDNYHKPSDTVEKINFDKLYKITRLAYSVGYTVANQPHRLKISNPVVPPIFSESEAAKYAGTYEVRGRAPFEITYEDSKLFLHAAGRVMMIEPIEGTKFHAKGMPLEFTFTDGESKASSVALTWGTFGTFVGTRLKDEK